MHVPPDRPPNPRFEKAHALGGALEQQLASYDSMLREENLASWQAYQKLIERLAELDITAGTPVPGDVLPAFELADDEGHLVSSGELMANGPLVISFNRGSWCPYCWLELCALESSRKAIVGRGGMVLSITPEIATFSRRLKKRLGLGFPVLTDLDNGYALELGLVFALSDDVREVYDRAGIDLGALQRSSGLFLPVPATLIVDRGGIVRQSYVNADFRERLEPGAIATLLAGL